MSSAHDYFVGLDTGATNVKGIAIRRDGTLTLSESRAIEKREVWRVAEEMFESFRDRSGFEADGVGVAAPGIADPQGQSIWWMQGRLAEIQGYDWNRCLRPRSGQVPVLNDAHAALLGEVWQGAAKDCRNVILLTLGTGVGGAAMVDGHLLRGHLGRAGHLGHISLDPRGAPDIVNTPGSLEDAVGECTLARRSGGRFQSTDDLLAAAMADDNDARRIWADSVRALAAGLASLVNVLDPEVVILGGGIVAAGDQLFIPLRAEMEKVEWRPHGRAVKIVPATGGEYAGAIGAALYAMEHADPR
jgi:glucokinase